MKALMITIGVFLGVATGTALRWGLGGGLKEPPPTTGSAPKAVVKVAPLPPLDPKAFKEAVWKNALERIEAADRQAVKEIEESLKLIERFFEQRKQGNKAFAEALLSLKGKWELVRSKLPGGDPDAHYQFLRQQFEKCLFQNKDVEDILMAAVAAHLSSLDGIDNQLLVNLRADIGEMRPDAALAISAVQSDFAFNEGYRAARIAIMPVLERDLRVSVATEVFSQVASEIATRIAIRVGAAIATKMGISVGILSTGAAASISTLGLSIVVGIVVDAIVDKIIREAGYDPEGEIAKRIGVALDDVRSSLIDGHPEAVGVHREATKLLQSSGFSEVREEAGKTLDVLERSGALGLKRELVTYTKARCEQRRAALKQLILGKSPVQGDRNDLDKVYTARVDMRRLAPAGLR